MKLHLYSLKVSANVKIAMQCFENSGGTFAPNALPGCAPAMLHHKVLLHCINKCDVTRLRHIY